KSLLEIDTGGGEEKAAASAPAQPTAPQRTEVRSESRREEPTQEARASGGGASAQLDSSTGDRELLATPAVRKLARDEGIDLGKVAGTGPFGRITREDVLKAAQGGQVISFTPSPPAPAAPPPRPQQQQQQSEARPSQQSDARPSREERLDR